MNASPDASALPHAAKYAVHRAAEAGWGELRVSVAQRGPIGLIAA